MSSWMLKLDSLSPIGAAIDLIFLGNELKSLRFFPGSKRISVTMTQRCCCFWPKSLLQQQVKLSGKRLENQIA